MSTPLLINEEVRADILRVRTYAERNPLSLEEVTRSIKGGEDEAVGNDPAFRLVIPMGFRTVFSIEELATYSAPTEGKWYRHLSVSMVRPGRMPIPLAMEMIAEEFGFKGKWKDWEKAGAIYIEQARAVNVLEETEKPQ